MKNSKYAKSQKLLKEAESSEAWATYRFKNYSQYEDIYPFYATHGKGPYIWDVDGNKYIDYLMGYGSVLLGHANNTVNQAVIEEVSKSPNLSPLWRPLQITLTKQIISMIPGAEMAYLMKTGSDATSGAIRLARLYTRRNKVVRWGYHGWHDWATAVPGGIPKHIKDDISEFEYNDISSVEKIFEENKNDIACVIMMPFEIEKPKDNFLQKVRDLAHQNKSLFILDEMRSGFRIAKGGAQEYFNIEADLSTFSKAIANGYAISAIVGKKKYLSGLRDTQLAATFYGNSVEMAAAVTTLEIVNNSDVIERIHKLGDYFRKETEKLIKKYSIPAKFLGYPPFPFLEFTFEDQKELENVKKTFYGEVVNLGVFVHPNHHWYISGSHTKEDIDRTVSVFEKGFKLIFSKKET